MQAKQQHVTDCLIWALRASNIITATQAKQQWRRQQGILCKHSGFRAPTKCCAGEVELWVRGHQSLKLGYVGARATTFLTDAILADIKAAMRGAHGSHFLATHPCSSSEQSCPPYPCLDIQLKCATYELQAANQRAAQIAAAAQRGVRPSTPDAPPVAVSIRRNRGVRRHSLHVIRDQEACASLCMRVSGKRCKCGALATHMLLCHANVHASAHLQLQVQEPAALLVRVVHTELHLLCMLQP
eukprot:1157850-Pelagomonas_calceolata.AAC.10